MAYDYFSDEEKEEFFKLAFGRTPTSDLQYFNQWERRLDYCITDINHFNLSIAEAMDRQSFTGPPRHSKGIGAKKAFLKILNKRK